MCQSKIGFITGHGESVYVGVEKNFTKFYKMTSAIFDNAENISENSCENLSDYSLIVIGSPIEPFSNSFLDKIREYVLSGGKLFVLLKYCIENNNNNLELLFDDIKPNNDVLTGYRLYEKYEHKPYINFKNDKYKIDEKFLYDGGCTLHVKGNVDLACKVNSHDYTTFKKVILNPPKFFNEVPINESNNTVMALKKIGKGSVIYFGARWTFSDERFDNSYPLLSILLDLLLSDQEIYNSNVKRRMLKIQRHRLLHGFPMPDANYRIKNNEDVINEIQETLDYSKKIALGVIAHPMCNPQVRGCGYCPFPHENYNLDRMKMSVDALCDEIDSLKKKDLLDRQISSVYFGGGTATLTEKTLFDKLCHKMKNELMIDKDTEITLEGTPGHFVSNKELMEIMRKYFPDSILRISMGIQTFDSEILSLAGRSLMNREGSVEETIKIAQELGFRISADFLFNLPYRSSFDTIKKDLDKAVSLGIEHICWYSLVLNESIKTPWAENQEILDNLPSKEQALENWLKLYECLKEYGYEATTVTDFRKKNSTEGHYQYEEDLRVPDKVDWIGLGSYGISLLTSENFNKGIKVINFNDLNQYVEQMKTNDIGWESVYKLNRFDLKLYWITRKIKGTFIPTNEYYDVFGAKIEVDFGNELKTLEDYKLLEFRDNNYYLTPKGFFYADTVAGHLAWLRVNELIGIKTPPVIVKKNSRGFIRHEVETIVWDNDSVKHFMG